MSRAYLRAAIGISVLSLGFTAGCIVFPVTEEMSGENRCTSTADCTSGTCELALGICIETSGTSLPIRLEITPSTPDAVTSYHQIDPAEGVLVADVQLDEPLNVVGAVTATLGGAIVPIEARLRFLRHIENDGMFATEPAIQTQAVSSEQVFAGVAGNHNYHVMLKRGREYSVFVEPSGDFAAIFAPMKVSLNLSQVNTETAYDFSIQMPVYTEQHECWGRLVDSTGEGISGLFVDAIEVASGRRLSTTARSCNLGRDDGMNPYRCEHEGEFRIKFPIGFEADYVLRVRGTNGQGQWPTQQIHSGDLPVGAYGTNPRLVQISPRQMVGYSGRVDLEDHLGDLSPMEGSTLSFHSSELRDPGVFQISATTDESGEFSALLAPGIYQLSITPPLDSLAVVSVQTVTINQREDGADIQGQAFLLRPRAEISGVVLADHNGNPVMGDVYASPIVNDPAAPWAWNRSNQAPIEEGGYRLPLDQGTYDFVFRPRSATQLAWHVLPRVSVNEESDEVQAVRLRSPRLLTGRILQGTEISADAEIRAYASIENSDGSMRDVQIARAQTDGEGNYSILLPPDLTTP